MNPFKWPRSVGLWFSGWICKKIGHDPYDTLKARQLDEVIHCTWCLQVIPKDTPWRRR